MTDAELNAAVAREVMGWRKREDCDYWDLGPQRVDRFGPTFTPSTSIADAFEVVERMEQRGWDHAHSSMGVDRDPGVIEWQFFQLRPNAEFFGLGQPGRAICEAALEAVRSDGKA